MLFIVIYTKLDRNSYLIMGMTMERQPDTHPSLKHTEYNLYLLNKINILIQTHCQLK